MNHEDECFIGRKARIVLCFNIIVNLSNVIGSVKNLYRSMMVIKLITPDSISVLNSSGNLTLRALFLYRKSYVLQRNITTDFFFYRKKSTDCLVGDYYFLVYKGSRELNKPKSIKLIGFI